MKRTRTTRNGFTPSAHTVTAALALLGGSAAAPAVAQDSGTPPPTPPPTSAPTPDSTPAPASTPTVAPAFDPNQRYDTYGRPIPTNTGDIKGKKGKNGKSGKDKGTGDTQYVPERPKGTAEKLFGPFFRDITLTGGFSTRFQQNSVNGTSDGSQRFSDQNLNNLDYRNVGPFQNNVDMTVQGRIFNAFNVNARLSNSRYGNYYNQVFAFDYHNRDNSTKLNLGNVNATLPGNQFVMFSRSVQGVRFERTGKLISGHGGNAAPRVSLAAQPTLTAHHWWEWPADAPTLDQVASLLGGQVTRTSPENSPFAARLQAASAANASTATMPSYSSAATTSPFGGNTPSSAYSGSPYNTYGNGAYGTNPYGNNSFGNRNGAGRDIRSSGNGLPAGDNASLTDLGADPFARAAISGGGGWTIRTQGVASLTRALTRRGSFRGTGTSGPYFLNAGSLIENSERVQLNGEELKPGDDYRIDYLLGQITFLKGRIINQEDTVTFTYEAQNFNTTPGLLTGSRIDLAGPNGSVYGLTYIQQKATGQKIRNGNLIERFPVMPDPAYRYALSSLIDPAYPVEIKWFNRVLVEGVDYILNRDLRYFQLITTALPPDSAATYNGNPSLSVTYRPQRQSSLAGDRSVLGLDSTFRLTKNSTMSLDFGRSEGMTEQQNGQAIAMRTTFNGSSRNNRNAWQWTTGVKQVGETFSTIDSTAGAFLQPERSFNTSVRFAPTPEFQFSTGVTQGSVGNRDYSSSSTTASSNSIVWATNRSLDFRATMTKAHLPTLNFSHQQTNQNSSGSNNAIATTSVDANWQASSQLQFSSSLTRTGTHGRSIYATAFNNNVTSAGNTGSTIIDQLQDGSGARTITNSTSDNLRFSTSYVPKAWLALTGDLGFSRSNSGTSAYSSRSTGVTARATPSSVFSFNASLTESSNGQSTAGFYNPGATGSSTIIPTNSSGQRTRTGALGLQYTPSSRLAGQINFNHTLSLVPGYDNTQGGGVDWNITATPKERWQVGLTGGQQYNTYVGGQGNSTNRSLSLTVGAGPFGRTKIDASLAHMNFGSASYFGTTGGTGTPGTRLYPLTRDTTTSYYSGTSGYFQQGRNISYSLNASYELGPRYSLIGTWQALDQSAPSSGGDSSSTYRAGTNFLQGQGSIGFDYRLTQILSFNVRFNYINLHDRDDSRYSYRARMLTADFGGHF